jgi:hypothetical protein
MRRIAATAALTGCVIATLFASSAWGATAPTGCSSNAVSYPVRTNSARVLPLTLACTGGGLPTSIEIVTPPAHGTATNVGDAVLYTPADAYTGSDQIAFRLHNDLGTSAVLTWALQTSVGADLVPALCTTTVPQHVRNDVPVTIGLSCSDEDVEPALPTIVSPPEHGTLSPVAPGVFDPVAGGLLPALGVSPATVTYTADPGYIGPDSFKIAGDDGRQVSSAQTVSLNVTDGTINHAPNCTSGAPKTAGTGATLVVLCQDPDGDALGVTTTQDPVHGSVGTWSLDATTGVYIATYTPDPGFAGADQITVKVRDARGAEVPGLVVGAWPSSPLPSTLFCNLRMLQVTRNVTVTTKPIVCTNGPGTPATISITTGPDHGTASLTQTGGLQYTPDRNYTGPDMLAFHAAMGSATKDVVVVVSVTSNAKTKILTGPPASSDATAQTFTLYGEPGVTLTCALSNSAASTPTPCANSKTYTGTPAGDHVLTVTATDAQGRTSGDSYAFTVTGPPAPPSGGGGGGSAPSGAGSTAAPSTTAAPHAAADPAPGPTADTPTTTPPAVTPDGALQALLGKRPSLGSQRHSGRVALRFDAPTAGQLTLRWTAVDGKRRVTLVTATTRVTRPGMTRITVRLTAAGRALLQHRAHRSLRVRASASFRPVGGARTVRTGAFTLRRS